MAERRFHIKFQPIKSLFVGLPLDEDNAVVDTHKLQRSYYYHQPPLPEFASVSDEFKENVIS